MKRKILVLIICMLIISIIGERFVVGDGENGKQNWQEQANQLNQLTGGNVGLSGDFKAPGSDSVLPENILSKGKLDTKGEMITFSFKEGSENKKITFNANEIKNFCDGQNIPRGQKCAELTPEGLKFFNGAVLKSGKVKADSDPGKLFLEKEGDSPVVFDVSKVQDRESLRAFETRGDGSVVIDHLGNTYEDKDMKFSRRSSDGGLKITANSNVKIKYCADGCNWVGTLHNGEMTMHPLGKDPGKTGMRQLHDNAEFTFQKGSVNGEPISLAKYKGKGAIFMYGTKVENIENFNFNDYGPIFDLSGGEEENRKYGFKVITSDRSGKVELSDVNPNEVKTFYADASRGGEIEWSYVSGGQTPDRYEAIHQFKNKQKGFFVNPRGVNVAPSVEVRRENGVTEVEVKERTEESSQRKVSSDEGGAAGRGEVKNQKQQEEKEKRELLRRLGEPDKEGIYTHRVVGATDLYFRRTDKGWEWSPDKRNWMSTKQERVSGLSIYWKQRPVRENLDLIRLLDKLNPDPKEYSTE